MKKVIVGISGGIDSAVTAYKLKKQGFEVIGVHLKVVDKLLVSKDKLNKIGRVLGIKIDTIDGSTLFKNTILRDFRNDHLAGKTPSPCASCNPNLKWKLLLEKAREENADFVASGHYIQKENKNGIWYLKKGEDPLKDQSYFLWGLKQEHLQKIITPLGNKNKNDVRKLASSIGLNFLTNQNESTGLCFAQELSYPELIKKLIPETNNITQGDVIDTTAKIIGKHNGYIYYTIGQKRNINFFDEKMNGMCVVAINSDNNTITVDTDDSLWCKEFIIDNCYFANENEVLNNDNLTIKVRGIGRNPKGNVRLKKLNKNRLQVKLDFPAWAMAPGQPVVFYQHNLLMGGGYMLK